MKDIVNISQELFNKIRSRFTDVSLGDQSGKNTSDPSNARFFNFNYLSHGKKDFGNVTISLIDEKSLKVYFNKDIATNLDTEDQDDWFKFLRDMRKFAKRSVLGFDTRDINRSSLELRDIMQQSANQGIQTTDEDIQESKMYGTKRKSYDHVGETRLIIKHINMVDEEKRGSRTRNIDAVFVETAEGERYKLRTTNLHGARAIGQHVAQGGTITDDRTEEIYNMVIEMQQLSKFLRATRNTSTFEDADIPHMVEAVRVRYTEVQRGLKTMRGPKGYNKFWDGYAPSENMELDSSDALKERFTTRFLDQRIEEALPFVYNAYHKMTEASKLTQSTTDEIDSWADSIAIPGEVKETKIQEGTWHLPSTSEEVEIFKKIMSKPLMFGNEGDDAINAIGEVFGDDTLYDDLFSAFEVKGPEGDARGVIVQWFTGVWKEFTIGGEDYPEQEEFKEYLDQIGSWLRTWSPEDNTDVEPAPADAEGPDEEQQDRTTATSTDEDDSGMTTKRMAMLTTAIGKHTIQSLPKATKVESVFDELTSIRQLAGLK